MKLFLAFLTTCVVAVASSLGEAPIPVRVEFLVPAEGWYFTAYPDGAIHGQFGSASGDSIQLPPGTIEFSEVVRIVKRQLPPTEPKTIVAAVRHKDEISVTLKPIADGGYFGTLFLKHRNDWRGLGNTVPSERVLKLMQGIGYYKQPNKPVDSTATRITPPAKQKSSHGQP